LAVQWIGLRRQLSSIDPHCWKYTNPMRKRYPWDRTLYRARNVSERMFCRLKDFRRIATRCDKRADTYLSAVLLAATVIWWLN